jgi:hypothetical protein
VRRHRRRAGEGILHSFALEQRCEIAQRRRSAVLMAIWPAMSTRWLMAAMPSSYAPGLVSGTKYAFRVSREASPNDLFLGNTPY